LVAGFISFRAFYKSKGGKSTVDKLLLVMPVFGDIISKVQVYEMARLLHMLLKSGIPIIDALKATSKALSNYHYKTALENAAVEVSKGVPLAVPLSRSRVIPLIVVKLIATGEQTGKTDQILAEITRFYGDQVEEITSNLTKLMEPIILVIAGGMVAFLALAIYVPIYNLGNVIK
jgi:type IV pilus assembly protein PilC